MLDIFFETIKYLFGSEIFCFLVGLTSGFGFGYIVCKKRYEKILFKHSLYKQKKYCRVFNPKDGSFGRSVINLTMSGTKAIDTDCEFCDENNFCRIANAPCKWLTLSPKK